MVSSTQGGDSHETLARGPGLSPRPGGSTRSSAVPAARLSQLSGLLALEWHATVQFHVTMSNNEHSDGRGEAHRPVRCTFGPVRERDLVWPPSDADLDAMTVVRLDDGVPPPLPPPRPAFKPTFGDCRAPGVAPRVRPLVVPMLPPEGASALVHETKPKTTAEKPSVGELATERSVVLEHPVEALPDHAISMPAVVVVPSAVMADDVDPDSTTASRSAWLAAIFAAACAILAVAEYRMIVSLPAAVSQAAVEPPPMPPDMSTADLAPAAPRAGSPVAYTSAAKMPASQGPVRVAAAESARPTAVAESRPSREIARPPAPTPAPVRTPVKPPIGSSPPTRPVSPPAVLTARASAPAPASLTSVSPAATRPPAVVASRAPRHRS